MNRRDVTTVDEVRSWLRSSPESAAVVADAHRAAEGFVFDRTRARWSYRTEVDPVTGYGVAVWDPTIEPPDALVQAVKLLAHRYLARRNSPDGLAGMGEMVGRVPISDRDADALLRPWTPFVFG